MSDEPQLHERLRDLLPNARAESCQVAATFLDIRSFSAFAAQSESFDAAIYLRSVYQKVLSGVFSDADFFKPTGDGLLLIHELPPNAEAVPGNVSSILARAVTLVGEFGQITSDDYMINVPVPERLGVGIARGSATRLMSDGGVLDYTGRCLNLAARLMDKARPFGVVFADSQARHVMTPEIATLFTDDAICIRGLSEQTPIPIFISEGVKIARSDREPISETRHVWGQALTLSVAEIRESSWYGFPLPRRPRSYERVGVYVEFPVFDKAGRPVRSVQWLEVEGLFVEQPNGPLVQVNLESVKDSIKGLPVTTTNKLLGWTTGLSVKFIPFCAPMDAE